METKQEDSFYRYMFQYARGKIVHREEDGHLVTCPECFLVRERLQPEKQS